MQGIGFGQGSFSPQVPLGAAAARRSRISPAARRVNVTATMAEAGTPRSRRRDTRPIRVRVLPEPGPASTSTGPGPAARAFSWPGVKPGLADADATAETTGAEREAAVPVDEERSAEDAGQGACRGKERVRAGEAPVSSEGPISPGSNSRMTPYSPS